MNVFKHAPFCVITTVGVIFIIALSEPKITSDLLVVVGLLSLVVLFLTCSSVDFIVEVIKSRREGPKKTK